MVIREGCFIGANSIILKGTTLGKNVVVGLVVLSAATFQTTSSLPAILRG